MYTQKPNYIHFFQLNLKVFALKLLVLLKLKEMINKFVICDFFFFTILTTFAHKTVIPPQNITAYTIKCIVLLRYL